MQSAEPVASSILDLAHAAIPPIASNARLLENVRLCLLPMTNPDGAAEGRSVTNARGEVPKFSLDPDGADGRTPAEARVLWEYLSEVRPDVLIEQHMHYTWARPWVRRYNPTEVDYVPVALRDKAARLTAAADGLLSPTLTEVAIDPRLPDHACYGVQHMVERLGVIPFSLQGHPDSTQANAAELWALAQAFADTLREWRGLTPSAASQV